jgi:hypothetical protein
MSLTPLVVGRVKQSTFRTGASFQGTRLRRTNSADATQLGSGKISTRLFAESAITAMFVNG